MIPHPSRELVALLLELIEELLHLGRLLADLSRGELPGVGIGVDQPELLEGWA